MAGYLLAAQYPGGGNGNMLALVGDARSNRVRGFSSATFSVAGVFEVAEATSALVGSCIVVYRHF